MSIKFLKLRDMKMARKQDIDEIIKKKINKIMSEFINNDCPHKSMLQTLWLIREYIHKTEKNLLQDLTFGRDCDSYKSSNYANLKVGKIAQNILKPLLESKKWGDDDLKSFLDKADSRKIFGLGYPLLSLDRYDKNGYPRYYKEQEQIIVNGKPYFFCSQWNEKPSRAKLMKFINQHKGSVK